MNIKIKHNEIKGCLKEFTDEFYGDRICGGIEDLKHSDHILLCQECKKKFANQKQSEEVKNGE